MAKKNSQWFRVDVDMRWSVARIKDQACRIVGLIG